MNLFRTEHGALVRPITSTSGWYGVEQYEEKVSVVQRALIAATYKEDREPEDTPLVVDFGGASGFWGNQMAMHGEADVLIVDMNVGEENRRIIDEHNRTLSRWYRGSGQLFVREADIRTLTPESLKESFGGRTPSVFSAFNLIHFMDLYEIHQLFKLTKKVAGKRAIFGVSYHFHKAGTDMSMNLKWHKRHRIQQQAGQTGWDLAFSYNYGKIPHHGVDLYTIGYSREERETLFRRLAAKGKRILNNDWML